MAWLKNRIISSLTLIISDLFAIFVAISFPCCYSFKANKSYFNLTSVRFEHTNTGVLQIERNIIILHRKIF